MSYSLFCLALIAFPPLRAFSWNLASLFLVFVTCPVFSPPLSVSTPQTTSARVTSFFSSPILWFAILDSTCNRGSKPFRSLKQLGSRKFDLAFLKFPPVQERAQSLVSFPSSPSPILVLRNPEIFSKPLRRSDSLVVSFPPVGLCPEIPRSSLFSQVLCMFLQRF